MSFEETGTSANFSSDFFFFRQKTQIMCLISAESACIEELFQMAFENATGSIFISTKLAPQPSSEAANGLTA